jgi:hypothetical protein
MDRMAENVKRGLRFGPLDFQLGLMTGWEYSSTTTAFSPLPRLASPTSARSAFGLSTPASEPATATTSIRTTRPPEPGLNAIRSPSPAASTSATIPAASR